MTAGLHHRWRGTRRRPAPASGRATRALDVCCGTGDLALELAGAGRPGGAGRRLRLLRADARRSRARRRGRPTGGARSPSSSGPTRSSCPTTTAASTPSPSASAPATSPTSTAGLREMAPRRAPRRPRRRARDHARRRGRRSRPSSRSGSTGSCRCIGRLAGDSDAYSYLPELGQALPAPARLAASDGRCRPRDVRWTILRRRDHRDPRRRVEPGERDDALAAAGAGAAVDAICAPPGCRRGCARSSAGSARRSPAADRRDARRRRRHDRRRRQAAAAAARLPLRRRRDAGDARPVRAGAAVELVHMATLVHDDVLDARRAAPRACRPSSPRGRRGRATATGDLLFSRAFAELAATAARRRACARCSAPARRSRAGELLQRAGRLRRRASRRALPASAAS